MVFPDITISNSPPPPPNDTDDISVFLRQLIQRSSTYSSSSSSSSSSTLAHISTPMRPHAGDHNLPYPSLFSSSSSSVLHHLNSTPPAIFSGSDRLFVDRISRDPCLPSHSSYFPLAGGGSNISSDAQTGLGQPKSFDNLNDCTEDCDYESEEGAEIMGSGEAEMKQHSSRNQSKRTRAAEVHNLSEKRRRSRINEKMKALQNLIPNSNKTDKASMLDEAIEYLKQLQLQVQMLSMRNGLNLHTMCLPGEPAIPHATQLPHMRIHNLNNNSGSFDITKALNQVADVSDTVFNFENLCTSSSRPSLPIASTVINSEATTFGLESCIPPKQHFHVQNSSQAICSNQNLPHERLLGSRTEMKPSATTTPLWFDTGEPNVEGHNSLEDRTHMKYGSQGVFLDNSSGQNQRMSSYFSGLYADQNDKLAISR